MSDEIVYITNFETIKYIKRYRKQYSIIADIYKRNWLEGIYVSVPPSEAARLAVS